MTTNRTPEQLKEAGRKAAETRKANREMAAAGDVTKWIKLPSITLKMVRETSADFLAETNQIRCPTDAAYILMPHMQELDREHLVAVLLDTRNRVIGINTVAVGSLNSTAVSMRELFKPALLANAAGLIVAHNHPSGDPTPSPEDVAITRDMVQAGQLLGVQILDHVVIGAGTFVSLKERGLGF